MAWRDDSVSTLSHIAYHINLLYYTDIITLEYIIIFSIFKIIAILQTIPIVIIILSITTFRCNYFWLLQSKFEHD